MCSIQLSYYPDYVKQAGFEPATQGLGIHEVNPD